MPLKDAELESEAQLEEILLDSPDSIEDGFRLLRNQKRTTPYRKELDILGVDSEGTLTVVELKVKEDDRQLPQAIEYFDWLLERGLSAFRDYFSDRAIQNKIPRIILIAPEFGERTVKLCKYISEDIQVSLKKCFCFDFEGKREVKLVEVQIPPRNQVESPTKLEDHVNYIEDENVRKVFNEAITRIKQIDENKVKYNLLPYRVNFIHKDSGLKFAELYRKRKYFVVNWKEEDEWDHAEIRTAQEFEKILSEKLHKALELVKER